jgi:hypothetical protein
MKDLIVNDKQCLYDTTVKTIDQEAQRTTFETPDGSKTCPIALKYGKQGECGVLTLTEDGHFLSFHAYAEQRLRRWPEHDYPGDEDRGIKAFWGWRLLGSDDCISCKPHFVPGQDGRFIADEATPVEVALPPEFVQLCKDRDLTPEQVLNGFIADLCGLMNYVNNPREDDLSSNGSDERMFARQWFDRAYFS